MIAIFGRVPLMQFYIVFCGYGCNYPSLLFVCDLTLYDLWTVIAENLLEERMHIFYIYLEMREKYQLESIKH